MKSQSMTRDQVAVLPTKQIAAMVAAARGIESYKPAAKADALKAYEKTIGFAKPCPTCGDGHDAIDCPVASKKAAESMKRAIKREKKAESVESAPVVDRGPHPGFDAKTFELTYDRRNPKHHQALMTGFEKQARTIVDMWSKTSSRMTGAELRAFLEDGREKNFPGSKQREIVRIFQDYRKRLVDAGFVRVSRSVSDGEPVESKVARGQSLDAASQA